MRSLRAAAAIAIALLLPFSCANPSRVEAQGTFVQSRVPLGYQQITTLTSSTALTVPAGATAAVITAESQAVRYRDDGTAPSATVGMPLAVATTLVYTGTLSAIRFIEQTSAAKLNVAYYR